MDVDPEDVPKITKILEESPSVQPFLEMDSGHDSKIPQNFEEAPSVQTFCGLGIWFQKSQKFSKKRFRCRPSGDGKRDILETKGLYALDADPKNLAIIILPRKYESLAKSAVDR